jgi:glycosyltransferase involved in cell wall biosynthesis
MIFKNSFFILCNLLLLRLKKKQVNKILLVAEYGKNGGTRTYFISLLKFLKKQEYNVTVLMNNSEADPEVDSLILAQDFKTLSVNFDFWCIDLNNPPIGLTKKQLISYQLREMLFWCKILRQQSFSAIVFSVGNPELYLYAFLLPVNIRYILHTQPVKLADKFKRWMLTHSLSAEKQIVTVSVSSKVAIENCWMQSESSEYLKVVHNFYEPQFKEYSMQNLNLIKRILSIGSCEAYKNPFLFIDCAKQIIDRKIKENLEFYWAGEGSLLDICRSKVKNYPQIKFEGHIENVEKLYNASAIYFQPSLQESHGIAVLGAMYHQLPCVVSNRGGLKESVIENVTGFVVGVDYPEGAVEKIQFLLQYENAARRMGQQGRLYFESKFTKTLWVQSMEDIFKNI